MNVANFGVRVQADAERSLTADHHHLPDTVPASGFAEPLWEPRFADCGSRLTSGKMINFILVQVGMLLTRNRPQQTPHQ